MSAATDEPAHRYTAELAGELEARWQAYWDDKATFEVPNPSGPLSEGWAEVADRAKFYLLDMFPYPSGEGLHVGHPLGYIGTDVYGRWLRMTGHNVVHTIGFDAFGLPAEQHAVETGQHPRVTTERNVANYRRQLRRLGLAHDQRRAVSTTDPDFVRWTQWIFLQIYNAWFDPSAGKARPIADLEDAFAAGSRPTPDGRPWADLNDVERRTIVDGHRLVYRTEAMVNWCPGLGTVLANEEVTADGRSDRGNFPVFRRPLTQWMMRITAFSDRLLDGLDTLDWPDPIKLMQRNWIGRSTGARVTFPAPGTDGIEVFTTRPDTLFGATYMVLSPEHPLVDALTAPAWSGDEPASWTSGAASPAAAVDAYRTAASRKSELERQADSREKTGVFTGSYATNPTNGQPVPVFVADYVLMGYGTGAIMAVPAHDERDFAFARAFDLAIVKVVEPPAEWPASTDDWAEAFTGDGPLVASANDGVSLDGLPVPEAKAAITAWLSARGLGEATVNFKLRDWLFSRQRYWGEPFPIVYDETGLPIALPETMLPVDLPEIDDWAPKVSDGATDTDPEPPLGRVEWWVDVELDLGDGPKRYRRETNTMPQWAGSCWYYLRYLDPTNENAFVDPGVEAYWMGGGSPGGVDMYVGGVEHAVLHLLYSRFWHAVLFDLGHVSTPEPFQRLFNQGYVQAFAFTDARGLYVPAADVVEDPPGTYRYQGEPVTREYGKMGKSLKNSVTPDEMCERYGADTLRLYEMATGPLDQSRPWSTADVVGVFRLLQRIWRAIVDEDTGALRVTEGDVDVESARLTARTVADATEAMADLRFNSAVARLTELTNHVTKTGVCHRATGDTMVKLLAPLAPHVAEELWSRLGNAPSIAYEDWPVADPAMLVVDTVALVVQVNGKKRDVLQVSPDIDGDEAQRLALASDKVVAFIDGADVRKVIARPPSLVNIVI